ncbi:MAG: uracil phosphoribosyltransferase [Actinomycetota bacterium]|nr:uracil phosphoribosyltransferase [Actinomycetota bacterium]
MAIKVVDHPVARHLLAELRSADTPPAAFRSLARKLAILLMIEATRDLTETPRKVSTPLEDVEAQSLADPIILVPILRAGLGLLDPIVDLFPEARVGYIGLERDEATFKPTTYYSKLPQVSSARVFVLDPMLATGGSAAAAIRAVREAGASWIRMISVVAAPEGVAVLEDTHPDVDIVTAALDRELNDRAFIVPGLGDFGDRLYGTED